ncbi:MAG: ATP-dependent DNA helicase RecG [Deinococcota bacterium]
MGATKTTSELRERLKRPLEQERANGYQDDVAVGGLEKLVRTLGKPFKDVQAIMAGYGELDEDARAARVDQALELLNQTSSATRSSSPKRTRKASAKPSSEEGHVDVSSAELLQHDVLDANLKDGFIPLAAQAPKKLATIGIQTYRDLLTSFPRRYEDRRALPYFGALEAQEHATVYGTITGRKGMKSKRGMNILRAFLEDGYGGKLTAVWFNQPWLEKQLFPGQIILVTGKLKRMGRSLELNVSDFEVNEAGDSLSFDRIVPVYTTTQGLSQGYIRRAVHTLLEHCSTLPDYLPKRVLERYHLVPLDEALRDIHFPNDNAPLKQALRRLKFDEFLFLELRLLLNRDTSLLGKQFKVRARDVETFQSSLPFTMTDAQARVLSEILEDMANPRQMARLLQGDVGSGKTAVAAACVYVATCNNFQAALMAPTEILARQHFLNLTSYLYPLGVRCELLIGTMTAKEQREAKARIASGEAQVAIGTHALIQDSVSFHDLGLAIVDEEHRFGVEQRRKLLGNQPDVLVMSATPIPRSMALTYYGDLELSIIDELPPGRKPITTRLVNDSKRREVYRFAWGQIQAGRQVYLVTPLIEESEALTGIVATEQLFDDLKTIMPQACCLAMLHGKMSGAEKDAVMADFRAHEVDMLVSTTVIEVGVDIPNASVMIIENAERFGLSQLHQLRGRVGRGEHESYCILIAGDRSKKTQQRLEIIEKYQDGFVIAEKDLKLRGPGELRGTRQSGVPDLVLGDLAEDGDIIEQAREFAVLSLEHDPRLEATWASRLRTELKRRSHSIGFREII